MSEFSPKFAAEVYPVTVDFAARLPAGVTVAASNAYATSAVTAWDGATDVSATVLVAGSLVRSGTQMQIWVTGGTPGKTYTLKFLAAASDNQVRKFNVRLYVGNG